MAGRRPISKRLRFEVFKRDGFTCQYCGATPPSVLLQCDHIEAVSRGGGNEIDNLVTACQPCNLGKSNVPLSQVPQNLADRAAETTEREEQIAGYQSALKAKRLRIDDESYEIVGIFLSNFRAMDGIPSIDFLSIKRFVEMLGLDGVIASAEYAIAKKPNYYTTTFKYFCGTCWGKIRDLEGSQ